MLIKSEYICILFLLIAVIVLLILFLRKRKRFKQEMAFQKSQCEQMLLVQEANIAEYRNQLTASAEEYRAQIAATMAEYQTQVLANLRDTIPFSEQLLIRDFRDLFLDPAFSDFVIYSHLEFEVDGKFRQVDFFVVSSKGLFVIESKRWKGVTYIYSSGFPDLFQKTAYSSFGVGSSEKVRVFNAQQSEDNAGQIQLSAYTNPVVQARDYSMRLRSILDVRHIKNVVVFNAANDYEVFFDNAPLSIVEIDYNTSLVSDKRLKDYFSIQPSNNFADTKRVIEFIEGNLQYKFKLCHDNYHQAPFRFADEPLGSEK